MPISEQHRVAVLDVSRPNAPREVSSLDADGTFMPHWSAADPRSDRIVVTGASRPGVDFGRAVWPHDAVGGAAPHAAVFVPAVR